MISLHVFITKMFVTFHALRGCHTNIPTITIITLWRRLRHYSDHICLILLFQNNVTFKKKHLRAKFTYFSGKLV